MQNLPDYKKTAIILACCGPGDTLLYIILPMFHDFFSVSLAEAGILLAVSLSALFNWHLIVLSRVYMFKRFRSAACYPDNVGTVFCGHEFVHAGDSHI